jgi:hypothetical protein
MGLDRKLNFHDNWPGRNSMFRKGINGEFVHALTEWAHWEEIVKDGDLFVGIRNGRVNIYFQGCSLFRISFKEKLLFETHYKYLVRIDLPKPYVAWDDDRPSVKNLEGNIFINRFDIGSLKRASQKYAEPEKAGLHRILRANANVVDVEVALSHESDSQDDDNEPLSHHKRVTDRIDFAAIQTRDGRPCVVFFEAKRFDNGELRSKTHKPPVIEQTERYKDFIENHLQDFKTSYGNVCKNLVELGLHHSRPWLFEVVRNPEQLEVSSDVRLVVYDFDQDQREGNIWKKHEGILRDHFTDRLLLKGSPREFKSGISWEAAA